LVSPKLKFEYRIDRKKIEEAIRLLLEGIGADVNDENFRDTPRRVADLWEEFSREADSEVDNPKFTQVGEVVLVGGVKTYSFCPHHLLPVEYEVYAAYKPCGEVVGLSKIPRVIHKVARKPLLQEAVTEEIADELVKLTGCRDVFVLVKGRHLCMVIRGVKTDAYTVTTASRGVFREQSSRLEVLRLIEAVLRTRPLARGFSSE